MAWKLGDNTPVRIELSDGDWVDVRAKLGKGAERRIQERILNARPGRVTNDGDLIIQDGNVGTLIDVAQFATMEEAILAWSSALPVTAANMRQLEDEDVKTITARLNELYLQPRSPDAAKN